MIEIVVLGAVHAMCSPPSFPAPAPMSCSPPSFPAPAPMSPPYNNTHVTNAWIECNNTRAGDPTTGACNKTNVTSVDWRVCERLCATDTRCYSWAWAANNHMCYSRSDCYWPARTGTVPGRISGYKGLRPPAPSGPPQTRRVAVPTPEQLAWMDMEVGAMLGFNLQTICVRAGHPNATAQRCQAGSAAGGPLFVPDRGHVAAWDPFALDTDAWVQAAASFGAKYAVLVADHMTGFTLWDTQLHNFSIAHTRYGGGGRDVVREFVRSCRKYGLRPGYFYSMHFNWFAGVDNFEAGAVPPLGPRSYNQSEYLQMAEAQLREIFDNSSFGEPPAELWFDGGTGPSNGTAARVVKQVAPRAMCHSCEPFTQDPQDARKGYGVRWMGNEEASMPLPSWAASTGGQHGGGTGGGDPLGITFQPPSCDAVLREHYWFWQPGTEGAIKSTRKLVDNYMASVGRAANLILNIAPDGTGAVPAVDTARYAEFGAAVRCLFSSRVAGGGAQNVSAGGAAVWRFPTGGAVASRNITVVLREDQRDGQLIGRWSLDCQQEGGGAWAACHAADEGIGHKRIVNVVLGEGAVGTAVGAMRLNVLSDYAMPGQVPRLRGLDVYDWASKTHCV